MEEINNIKTENEELKQKLFLYTNDGKNVTSCWSLDKKGICVIKKSKKNEWIQRLSALETQINYWINPDNKTNKTVEIIQLFYDV